MNLRGVCAVAALLSGCSSSDVISPTAVSAPIVVQISPLEGPGASPLPPPLRGLTVSGPSGCVDASTLPAVVIWTIEHLPAGATFAKGYHFDDTVNCLATEQHQRTQNSHLRIVQTGASARIEFDRDAFACRGRQQVDVSVNGAMVIGMIVTRATGKECAAPTPDPSVPPAPTPNSAEPLNPDPPPPPPPPPPVCAADNPPRFDGPSFTATTPGSALRASATVENGATWKLILYAEYTADAYPASKRHPKDTDEAVVPCGGSATLRVAHNWQHHGAIAWWTVLYRDGVKVETSPVVLK